VLSPEPLWLAITSTGVDKGAMSAEQILVVDSAGIPIEGISGEATLRSSAETALHLAIVRVRGAGAVLHTHSVWSTALSEERAGDGGIAIQGYEMLKGLDGVQTHEHSEWLPIIGNSQNMRALARSVEEVLDRHPAAHGFLLQGHGLYTWGKDLAEAKRHIEILEFLLEVLGRRRYLVP